MHQQAFMAIQKSPAKYVPVNEIDRRTKYNVGDAESNWAFIDDHLRSERRVAIGVVDEFFQISVRVMDQIAVQNASIGGHFHILVNGAKFKSGEFPLYKSKLAIWIISGAFDPFIQIKISARHKISVKLRRR